MAQKEASFGCFDIRKSQQELMNRLKRAASHLGSAAQTMTTQETEAMRMKRRRNCDWKSFFHAGTDDTKIKCNSAEKNVQSLPKKRGEGKSAVSTLTSSQHPDRLFVPNERERTTDPSFHFHLCINFRRARRRRPWKWNERCRESDCGNWYSKARDGRSRFEGRGWEEGKIQLKNLVGCLSEKKVFSLRLANTTHRERASRDVWREIFVSLKCRSMWRVSTCLRKAIRPSRSSSRQTNTKIPSRGEQHEAHHGYVENLTFWRDWYRTKYFMKLAGIDQKHDKSFAQIEINKTNQQQ